MRRREFVIIVGGAGVAWPLAARAQWEPVRRVGVLMAFDESNSRAKEWLSQFTQGLAGLGWQNGRNLRTEVRWAGDNVGRMQTFAKELVDSQPDVILAFGTPVTRALQRETRTIPIVFVVVSDPVGEGYVASLAHPGGNITGFLHSESLMSGKWLELLAEIAPGVSRAAALFNPETAPGHGRYYMSAFEAAARALKIAPIEAPVHSAAELEAVIAALGRERMGGFLALPDFFLFSHRAQMVSLAAQNKVPAVYGWREAVAAGGLASYGPDIEDMVRRAAPYVDRILRGANPAELPVQVPNKFETAVNVKAARALGVEVPTSILLRADEVIE